MKSATISRSFAWVLVLIFSSALAYGDVLLKADYDSPTINAYYLPEDDITFEGSAAYVDEVGDPVEGCSIALVEVYIDGKLVAEINGENGVSGNTWDYTYVPGSVNPLAPGSHTVDYRYKYTKDSAAYTAYKYNQHHFFVGHPVIKVNFQPKSTELSGYSADRGGVYTEPSGGSGTSFGWSSSGITPTGDGGDPAEEEPWPDQFYTRVDLPAESTAEWKLDLPQGRYQLEVVLGNPDSSTISSDPWQLKIEDGYYNVPLAAYQNENNEGFEVRYLECQVDIIDGQLNLSRSDTATSVLPLNHIRIRHIGPIGYSTRLYRGSGYTPKFHTAIMPFDSNLYGHPVEGLRSDNPETNLDESALWINKLYPSEPTGVFQQDNERPNDYFLAYDASHTEVVNGQPDDYVHRISNAHPIAVFGTIDEYTPIYTDQTYQIGLAVGEQLAIDTAPYDTWARGIRIKAYDKSSVDSGGTLPTPLTGVITLLRPDIDTDASEWDTFARDSFSKTLTVADLTVTVEYAPFGWGNGDAFPYIISQVASSDDYYYVIEVAGVVPDVRESGTENPIPMGEPATDYYPVYALSFQSAPHWLSSYAPTPTFGSTPAPPEYSGHTLAYQAQAKERLALLGNPPTSTSDDFIFTTAVDVSPNLRSPELRQHEILDEFVADEMSNDPLALAAFVQNEIELVDAFGYGSFGNVHQRHALNWGGVSRSALGTYLERQGSPIEQCALLVYLLRQAGVHAVYVFPNNPSSNATDGGAGLMMLESAVSRMIGQQWKGALMPSGIPYEYEFLATDSSNPMEHNLVPVNYPWVAAYVDVEGESKWISLFPWLKDHEIVEGYDLYDFLPERYRNGLAWVEQYFTYDHQYRDDKETYQDDDFISIFDLADDESDDAPSILYQRFLQVVLAKYHPTVSVDELGVRRTLRRNTYASWSDFPEPYEVPDSDYTIVKGLKDIEPYQTTIKDIFNKVRVVITDTEDDGQKLDTGIMRLCDLHNRQFYAWWNNDVRYQSPDSNGILLFEAEDYDSITNIKDEYDQDLYTWEYLTREYKEGDDDEEQAEADDPIPLGFSGGGVLKATYAEGAPQIESAGVGAKLSYEFSVEETGDYYVWIRGRVLGTETKVLYIGLNDDHENATTVTSTFESDDPTESNTFGWVNYPGFPISGNYYFNFTLEDTPSYYWHRFDEGSYTKDGDAYWDYAGNPPATNLNAGLFIENHPGGHWPEPAKVSIETLAEVSNPHTLNIWVKDDGFIIDTIMLTKIEEGDYEPPYADAPWHDFYRRFRYFGQPGGDGLFMLNIFQYWQQQPLFLGDLHLTLAPQRESAESYGSNDPDSEHAAMVAALNGSSWGGDGGITTYPLIDAQEMRLPVAKLIPLDDHEDFELPSYTLKIERLDYVRAASDTWDFDVGYVESIGYAPGFVKSSRVETERAFHYGEMAAICINVGRVSREMLAVHAERFWKIQSEAADVDADVNDWNEHKFNETISTIAYMMGMTYFERVDKFSSSLEDLIKSYAMSSSAYGLSKISPNYRSGIYLDGSEALSVPNIDMFYRLDSYVGSGNLDLSRPKYSMRVKTLLPVLITEGSAQEHLAVESFYADVEAISTVRLFHLAEKKGSPVEMLTYANYQQKGDGYHHNILHGPGQDSNTTGWDDKPYNVMLSEFSPSSWTAVEEVFEESPFSTVFMTPGFIESVRGDIEESAFVGVGTMTLGSSGASALIAPSSASESSSNGAWASVAYPTGGGFSFSNFSNISLSYDTHAYSYTSSGIIASGYQGSFSSWSGSLWGDSSTGASSYFASGADLLGYSITTKPAGLENDSVFTPSISLDSYDIVYSDILSAQTNFSTYSYQRLSSAYSTLHSSNYFDPSWSHFAGDGGYSGSIVSSAFNDVFDNGVLGMGASGTSWYGNHENSLQYVMDPVNVVTGEFYIDTVDLSLPGQLPLEIRRNYSSFSDANSILGHGWKYTLTPYLVQLGEDEYDSETNSEEYKGYLIYAADKDGSVVAYRNEVDTNGPTDAWRPTLDDNESLDNYNGGAIGSTNNPFHRVLTREEVVDANENHEVYFYLNKPDGSKYTYRESSFPVRFADDDEDSETEETANRRRPYLRRIDDAFGNYLTFEYYGDEYEYTSGRKNTIEDLVELAKGDPDYGMLKTIHSSNGNYLGFKYNTKQQVVEIYTHDGRRVKYSYNDYGDLVKVERPDKSTVGYEYVIAEESEPDAVEYRDQLYMVNTSPEEMHEEGMSTGSYYVARVRGWLAPEANGRYRFQFNTNNIGAMFLSESEKPVQYSTVTEDALISNHPTTTQYSDAAGIYLEGGKKYYIEILFLQWTSTEHLSVQWVNYDAAPGDAVTQAWSFIDGDQMIPWNPITRENGDTGSLLWEYFKYDGDYVGSNADMLNGLPEFIQEKSIVDSLHLLTRVVEPDGRVLENVYDPEYNPLDEEASAYDLRRVVEQYATTGDDLTPIHTTTYEYEDNWSGDTDYKLTRVISETQTETHGRPVTTYIYKDERLRYIVDPLAVGFSPSSTDVDHVIAYEWYDDDELQPYLDDEETIVNPDYIPGSYQRSLVSLKDKRGLLTSYSYDSDGNAVEISVSGELLGDGGAAETSTKRYHYNDNYLPVMEISQAPGQASNDFSGVVFYEYPTSDHEWPEGDLYREITFTDYISDEGSGDNTKFVEYAFLPTTIKQFAIVNPTLGDTCPTEGLISTTRMVYGSDYDSNPSNMQNVTRQAHGLLKVSSVQSNLDADDKTEVFWGHDPRGYVNQQTVRTFRDAENVMTGELLSAPSSSEVLLKTHYTYNDRGEVIMQADPAGRVVRYDYDALGRVKWTEHYESAESSKSLSWERFYYTLNGEVAWIDGPRYDPEDYVFYKYDGAGRVKAEIHWRSQAKADGTGIEAVPGQENFLGQRIVTYDYDGFGNLESVTDPLENTTYFEYDAIGRKTAAIYPPNAQEQNPTEEYEYEPGGQVAEHTSTSGGVTSILYNSFGSVLSVSYPDGSQASKRYYLDGRLKQENQPNGTHLAYEYNDAQLTVTKTLRAGTTFGQGEILSKAITQHDVRGNVILLTTFIDENTSYDTTSTYDGAGRIIATTGPGGSALVHAGNSEVTSEIVTSSYLYEYDATNGTFTSTVITGDAETITVEDALGRTKSVTVKKHDGVVAEETHYEYDEKHHYVTTTHGSTSADDMEVQVWTNVSGSPVLTKNKGNNEGNTYSLSQYNSAGQLTMVQDERFLQTTFSYDNRNRLVSTVKPDGSETKLGYDDEGNLVSREMPGGMTWTASYDTSNRMDWELLTGSDDTSTSRYLDYAYYSENNSAQGAVHGQLHTIAQKESPAGTAIITHTYEYDNLGRIELLESRDTDAADDASGGYYAPVDQAYTYDFRSLPQSVTRASPTGASVQVKPNRISYLYDGYGQLIDEKTELGTAGSTVASFVVESTHSHFVQHWDGMGRRSSLREGQGSGPSTAIFSATFTPAGRLDVATFEASAIQASIDYDYADNGLCTEASFSWGGEVLRKTAINPASSSMDAGRDERGMIVKRMTTGASAAPLLNEELSYTNDLKVKTYSYTRGNGVGSYWGNVAESRAYTYDPLSRRLQTETYYQDPIAGAGTNDTLTYTFDTDKLGVRTKAQLSSEAQPFQDATSSSPASLDAFFRVQHEDTDSGVREVTVSGSQATLPAVYSLWFDTAPSASGNMAQLTTFRPDAAGDWDVAVNLPSGGDVTLEARAENIDPALQQYNRDNNNYVEDTTTFELQAQVKSMDVQFDALGRTLSRSWAHDGSDYQAVQTLQWDATGKLIEVTYTDSRGTAGEEDYGWTASYDASGRRIETTFAYADSSLGAPVTITSQYDPQVEFMEIATIVDGHRTWKFYGNDIDAGYGSFEGMGGLLATIFEPSGQVVPVLSDVFGHTLAWLDTQSTTDASDDVWHWQPVQVSGYGPHKGFAAPVLATSTCDNLAERVPSSLSWQGRSPDPTGFYSMGTRYYESTSGRFLSPDPLGHEATPDLYSYASGDPINLVDPDGRMSREEFQKQVRDAGITERTTAEALAFARDPAWVRTAVWVSRFTGTLMKLGFEDAEFFARMSSDPVYRAQVAIDTVVGVYYAAKNPGETWDRVRESAKNFGNKVLEGDPEALAHLTYNVGTAFLPTKVALASRFAKAPKFIKPVATKGVEPNRIYSARELIRRADEPGPYHNFPESFNDEIFAGTRTVISPDYVQYTTRGTITVPGKPIYGPGSVGIGGEKVRPIIGHTESRVVEGTFEIGVRPSASGRTEVITHRFFRPDE